VTYRILSLDGGGSWALIEVKALMQLFDPDMPGRQVLSYFDLVAANSGGSIVLACLVEDMSLKQILQFFEDEKQRRAIFSPTEILKYRLAKWTGFLASYFPKYSAPKKLPALEKVLKQTGKDCLNGITSNILSVQSGKPVHLVITSFDYDRNAATFFRSGEVKSTDWGTGAAATVTLAEAVHASANPPVKYFDGPADIPGTASRYWDGGLAGCNNPVLAAVAEAVGMGVQPEQIIALSLGTGRIARPLQTAGAPASPLFQPIAKVSWHGDLEKVTGAILDDPPDAASFYAHIMTGSGAGVPAILPDGTPVGSRIVRMNPLMSPIMQDGGWKAPGDLTDSQFGFLVNLNLDAIHPCEVNAIAHYADLWVDDLAPNQPVRMDGATLKCEIGQPWFSEALEAWKALGG